MNEVIVSIIVPIYNCGKYLRECLDSILNQSYKNIEVICVDDGSSDDTPDILSEYGRDDERMSIITQVNSGVVTARKNGVSAASGKYVMFVDADDTIHENMAENLLMAADGADLVTSGVGLETKSRKVMYLSDNLEQGIYRSAEALDKFYENMIRFEGEDKDGILPYCIGKLYRKDILDSVMDELDPMMRYAEDRELVYRYVLKAGPVVVTHRSYYFYRYRSDSALHGTNLHAMQDLYRLHHSLSGLFASHGKAESLLSQLEQLLCSRIYMITTFMGFPPEYQTVRYIMPYFEGIAGKKLVLYGAGVVGCNYYRQTQKSPDIHWVLWADKSPRQKGVTGVSAIKDTEFDFIIIAVKEQELSLKIRNELQKMGAADKKILWKAPISLAE